MARSGRAGFRGSFWGSGRAFRRGARQLMTDAVEKGQLNSVEIFAFLPVGAGLP